MDRLQEKGRAIRINLYENLLGHEEVEREDLSTYSMNRHLSLVLGYMNSHVKPRFLIDDADRRTGKSNAVTEDTSLESDGESYYESYVEHTDMDIDMDIDEATDEDTDEDPRSRSDHSIVGHQGCFILG